MATASADDDVKKDRNVSFLFENCPKDIDLRFYSTNTLSKESAKQSIMKRLKVDESRYNEILRDCKPLNLAGNAKDGLLAPVSYLDLNSWDIINNEFANVRVEGGFSLTLKKDSYFGVDCEKLRESWWKHVNDKIDGSFTIADRLKQLNMLKERKLYKRVRDGHILFDYSTRAVNGIFKAMKMNFEIILYPIIPETIVAIIVRGETGKDRDIIGMIDTKSWDTMKHLKENMDFVIDFVQQNKNEIGKETTIRFSKGYWAFVVNESLSSMKIEEYTALSTFLKGKVYSTTYQCPVLLTDMNNHFICETDSNNGNCSCWMSDKYIPFIDILFAFTRECDRKASDTSETMKKYKNSDDISMKLVNPDESKKCIPSESKAWCHNDFMNLFKHRIKEDCDMKLPWPDKLVKKNKSKKLMNIVRELEWPLQDSNQVSKQVGRRVMMWYYEKMSKYLYKNKIELSLTDVVGYGAEFSQGEPVFAFYNENGHAFALCYVVNDSTMDSVKDIVLRNEYRHYRFTRYGQVFGAAFEVGASMVITLNVSRVPHGGGGIIVSLIHPFKKNSKMEENSKQKYSNVVTGHGYQITSKHIMTSSWNETAQCIKELLIAMKENEYYVYSDKWNEMKNRNNMKNEKDNCNCNKDELDSKENNNSDGAQSNSESCNDANGHGAINDTNVKNDKNDRNDRNDSMDSNDDDDNKEKNTRSTIETELGAGSYYILDKFVGNKEFYIAKVISKDGSMMFWTKNPNYNREDQVENDEKIIEQEYSNYIKLTQIKELRNNLPKIIKIATNGYTGTMVLFLSDEGDPIDTLPGMTNEILNEIRIGFEKKLSKMGIVHPDWKPDQIVINQEKHLSNIIINKKNKRKYIDRILKHGKIIDWDDSYQYEHKSNEGNKGIKWKVDRQRKKRYHKHKRKTKFDSSDQRQYFQQRLRFEDAC